jgi:hypothetical protein
VPLIIALFALLFLVFLLLGLMEASAARETVPAEPPSRPEPPLPPPTTPAEYIANTVVRSLAPYHTLIEPMRLSSINLVRYFDQTKRQDPQDHLLTCFKNLFSALRCSEWVPVCSRRNLSMHSAS